MTVDSEPEHAATPCRRPEHSRRASPKAAATAGLIGGVTDGDLCMVGFAIGYGRARFDLGWRWRRPWCCSSTESAST